MKKIALLTVLLALAAASADAQVDGPSTGTPERRSLVRLTLDDAVRRAIEHNPELAIVRLGTEVEAARVGESRGAFVPVFSTQFGRSSSVTPPANLLLGERGVDVDDWFSSTGVRQRLLWGSGSWSASWETSRTTTNNPIASFEAPVSCRWLANWTIRMPFLAIRPTSVIKPTWL